MLASELTQFSGNVSNASNGPGPTPASAVLHQAKYVFEALNFGFRRGLDFLKACDINQCFLKSGTHNFKLRCCMRKFNLSLLKFNLSLLKFNLSLLKCRAICNLCPIALHQLRNVLRAPVCQPLAVNLLVRFTCKCFLLMHTRAVVNSVICRRFLNKEKISVLRNLQPKIPVLKNIQGFIKPAACLP